MVDKKTVILFLSIIILTGCGIKKVSETYYNDYNNIAYVNEGNQVIETTTTSTTTTRKIVTNAVPTYKGSSTSELRGQADAYINKYKDKIDEMINLINTERAKEGISPVQYDYNMTVAATVRSLEMKETDVFEHARQCPDNVYSNSCRKWSTVFTDLGIKYTHVGENIARGFVKVDRAMNGFMNSPTHRKNIMNPDFHYVGIGVAEDDSAYFFSQEFKA